MLRLAIKELPARKKTYYDEQGRVTRTRQVRASGPALVGPETVFVLVERDAAGAVASQRSVSEAEWRAAR